MCLFRGTPEIASKPPETRAEAWNPEAERPSSQPLEGTDATSTLSSAFGAPEL